MTLALFATAYRMPSAMSANEPLPVSSSTFTGKTQALGATPAVPVPGFCMSKLVN